MSQPKYVVGVDLGTTHCALAYSPVGRIDVRLFDIPQLTAPGTLEARPLLPSFSYLPAEGEFAPGDLTLPWTADGPPADPVGELARQRGAQVPGRLIASAKSWICHGGVNRRAPILPWSAPEGAPQISPYTASVRYLDHLRAAWDDAHPDAPLADQEVVVTVPASFDEVARELTADAARAAGLAEIRLIEEPQAALYDFIGAKADDLRAALGDARLVLVVDVGGGTTDLTLVRVHPGAGAPELERIAVGGHLMLGGDNMDAALAHHVLAEAGITRRLDPTEWAALVQQARRAKEQLLAADAPASTRVSVQKRGRRLLGGTKTVELQRDAVRDLLLDGFAPHSGPTEVADRKGRAGLTTLGLPYTTDAAIPRHVCAFLRRHAHAAAEAGARVYDGLPRPDRILLNGGVFNAPALVERLRAVFGAWFGEAPVDLLPHTSLDTAVARGAARYALGRRGLGQLIGGGTARAYYVGVEGQQGRKRAFCVAPKGMDDGSQIDTLDQRFDLIVDRPVNFPLYAYTGDRNDEAGAVIDVDSELDALPAIQTRLKRQGDMWVDPETGRVPVRLSSTLTEDGALELYLLTLELPPRRWRLQFSLEPDASLAPTEAPAEKKALVAAKPQPLPPKFKDAQRAIARAFGPGRVSADPKLAKNVRRAVEELVGGRGQWSLSLCRALFDVLIEREQYRGVSALHEMNWLRLLSWAVRPGFGLLGDEARVAKLWALHDAGLAHPKAKANWGEWWILWRRVAPGLDRAQQQALFEDVTPWLAPKARQPQGPRAHGHPEMIRLLGALERLSPDQKISAGEWFELWFKKINSWWPIGRLGARELFHGDPADVVPRAVAERWLETLLTLDWQSADGADFAAVLLARFTGDAGRDVCKPLRDQVLARLNAARASSVWIDMLTKPTALSEGDARRLLGDALPAGLRLA